MGSEVILTDNSGKFLTALAEDINRALEAVGIQAETYTKNNLTSAGKRDTGNLINSLSHKVVVGEKTMYIGTNVKYAPYVEYGTGVYGENGGTGGGYWVYVTGGSGSGKASGKRYDYKTAKKIVAILRSKGIDAHMTQGQKPTHFLRNALQDHVRVYEQIIEKYIK